MDFPKDFGPYHLLKQIAMGGMAEIVLAQTKGSFGFEKLLALKMIHPKFSQDNHFINMLIEEAKISVELDHVNIGQVFDLGKLQNTYFISMEYVEGADVFKIMRRATEIGYEVPIESCAHIGQEICGGLEYAHTKRDSEGHPLGIIHRDMSPQNVMISYAGEVKIVDFGIAKADLRAKQTEVGVIKGKYYYMSPEQAWGDPIDHRTDVFSAGIIVYEMLTSQMLYLEENIEILLDRVRKADIKPPSTLRREIPSELDDIVMKALAKQPEDRYQTAHEMGQALSNFVYNSSPDYTSARLASMLAWLFDEEAHKDQSSLVSEDQDNSLLLTRNDFTQAPPKASGSLLFEFQNLVEVLERSEDPGETTDTDPTSQVLLPEMLPGFLESYGGDQDTTDSMSAFSLPYDGHLSASDDRIDDWGDGDEPTNVETTEDLLKRFRADLGQSSESQAPKDRQSHDVTQKIDTFLFESKKAEPPPGRKDSSYVPPPPPPPSLSSKPVASAGPSKPPPPRPSPSSPPSPRLHPSSTIAPSSRNQTLIGMSPEASRPPKSSSVPPNLPPPPASLPEKSAPPPIPRPAAPPPKPPAAPQQVALESPGTVQNVPSASLPLPPPDPNREGTGPTALVPSNLQLDLKTHEPTGPTNLTSIPVRRDNRPPELPEIGHTGDQTNPTVVLPEREYSLEEYESADSDYHTREIELSPPSNLSSAPRKDAAPDMPPWLVGGSDDSAPPPSLPGEELFRTELYMAPPDAEDIAVLRQASLLKKLRKIVLPASIAVVLIVAAILLWPRPDPVSTLDIRSHPPGAQIFLDGQRVPTNTPTKLEELEQGSVHQVELRLEGFTPWAQAVQLNAEEVRQIAVLSPIRGTLRATSEPSGASVIIDGVYRGQTPHVVEGLDINRDVAIQIRYEERTQTQTLVWGGRTEATSHFTFESRQRRRGGR